jgi:hypothetical protein
VAKSIKPEVTFEEVNADIFFIINKKKKIYQKKYIFCFKEN